MLHDQRFESFDDLKAKLIAHGYYRLEPREKKLMLYAFSICKDRPMRGAFTENPRNGFAFVVLRRVGGYHNYENENSVLELVTDSGVVVLYCIP